MLDLLNKGPAWVEFIYTDNSRKLFRSTLNKDILNAVNAPPSNDSLFDLDRCELVVLPENVTVKIYEKRPSLGRIDEFANKFI